MAGPDHPTRPPPHPLARQVLRAPAIVRRAAARRARNDEERWILAQSRDVRESYVREVLDRGGGDRLAEIWMLRQPDHVRESYIAQVLHDGDP